MPHRVRPAAEDPVISRSNQLWERAQRLIPAGTQTLAKGPSQFVGGLAPKYLSHGRGAWVWDVDGNAYLDYSMGVGPLVLGYAHPTVDDAIRAQLQDGITFSLMHPLEVELAERVARLVPGAQAVRFSKTGCDVTSAAVRLARAFTGRERVLCCGYHGWHDWYIASTDRAAGIPQAVRELTSTFDYNDLASVAEALDDDVACVILEPVTFEPPRRRFLHELKRLCHERGALLIFDEMWTGFRLALGGAQEFFGVSADLACFSKAVANGMPLSVLTGRRDVMALLEHEVFFFTTFGGEALSLAAAAATLDVLEAQQVPGHLARLGVRLQEGLRALIGQHGPQGLDCVGYPCRTLLRSGPELGDALLIKSFVQQELLRRGVLWGGFHNLSFAHTDADLTYTLAAYGDVLAELRVALAANDLATRVRGRPVAPVFRRSSGFNTKPRPVAARA